MCWLCTYVVSNGSVTSIDVTHSNSVIYRPNCVANALTAVPSMSICMLKWMLFLMLFGAVHVQTARCPNPSANNRVLMQQFNTTYEPLQCSATLQTSCLSPAEYQQLANTIKVGNYMSQTRPGWHTYHQLQCSAAFQASRLTPA